jgi:hypothetical protein
MIETILVISFSLMIAISFGISYWFCNYALCPNCGTRSGTLRVIGEDMLLECRYNCRECYHSWHLQL